MGSVHTILCQIHGLWNETRGNTVGCTNCTDRLLMCEKNWCYKAAMNVSVKKMNAGVFKSWKELFLQAVQDVECNSKVGESDDPIATMNAIIAQRLQTPGSPGEKCIQWHCQVMMQAVTDMDLSSKTGVCTNKLLTKPDYYEKHCVCNSMKMTLAQAQTIVSKCGPQSAALPARVFDMLITKKAVCMQDSFKAAELAMPAQFVKTGKLAPCLDWVGNAAVHNQLFKAIAAAISGLNSALVSTYAPCTGLFCKAFALAIDPLTAESMQCSWDADPWAQFNLAAATDTMVQCDLIGAESKLLGSTDKIGRAICNTSLVPAICAEREDSMATRCPGVTMAQFDAADFRCSKAQLNANAATTTPAAPASNRLLLEANETDLESAPSDEIYESFESKEET